jgi:predicted nucleic acid-binding protein
MIVLDASVALKWFVPDEPLAAEAQEVLTAIEQDPRPYAVPELFQNEVLAVLCRLPDATAARVQEALSLLEGLGLARIGNGHDLLQRAAELARGWNLSGYDAVYVALAELVQGQWLTADRRAARKVRRPALVRVLGA